MSSQIWDGCIAAADEPFIRFVAELRGWPPEFVRWGVSQGYLGAKDGDVVFPAFNLSGDFVSLHRRDRVGDWTYEPSGVGPFAATTYGTVASSKAVILFESPWDGLTFLLILWSTQPDQRERILVNICIIVTDGANNFMRADRAIPAGIFPLVAVMQNDTPKKVGELPAAEGWLAGLRKVLGAEIPAVYPPAGIKDLNDWARAGASIDTMRKAILGAVGSYTRTAPVPPTATAGEAQFTPEQLAEVDVDDEAPEEFPLDVLPPALREFVSEVVRARGVPSSLPAIAVLAAVSTALGKGVSARLVENYTTPPNLYLVGITPSGKGKSGVLSLAIGPLLEIEEAAHKEWRTNKRPRIQARLQQIEFMIEKLRIDSKKGKCDADVQRVELESLAVKREQLMLELELEPRLIAEDCTPEKLALLQAANGETMAQLSAEAGDAIGVLNGRYQKGGDASFTLLLKSFSHEACRVDRMGRESVMLRQPCLTLGWLLQPHLFAKLVKTGDAVRCGLLPRMLIANATDQSAPTPEIPVPINKDVIAEYNRLIGSLVQRFRRVQVISDIPVTEAARKIMWDFARERRQAADAAIGEMSAFPLRHAENACRLAIVLHCAEHGANAAEMPIDEARVSGAIRLVKWFSAEQELLMANTSATAAKAEMDALLEWFANNMGQPVTARQLCRKRVVSTATIAHQLLEELVKSGAVLKVEILTKGRPKIVFVRRC